ncbi:MAG: TfoX/Sxy family protein [Micropruina sp.]|nr:TfoX/Sxy family protein [Micropruina sp.]
MPMPKHSDEAKSYFRSLVPGLAGVEVRPMFGSVAAFVNGNMFAGLFGENVGVKLDAAGLAELAALPGSGTFGPPERPMGGYLSLPEGLPDPQKTLWLVRAHGVVAALPPKETKARR